MAVTANAGVAWTPTSVRGLAENLARGGATRMPSVAVEPTCACGQALECSHTAHCPRCGVTLRA
jgi:uncharacterized paraquat-inducible protein A